MYIKNYVKKEKVNYSRGKIIKSSIKENRCAKGKKEKYFHENFILKNILSLRKNNKMIEYQIIHDIFTILKNFKIERRVYIQN